MSGLISRLAPYALAFSSSLFIMVLELVASRLVARHVGASLHVWTSVIGIILGGICLGNVLGGRLSDRMPARKAVGPLFAMGAGLTLGCLWMNAVVGKTPGLDLMPWSLRTLLVVSLDFLVPATVIGMIGPVVAKMAVEQSSSSGSAIGNVYFWGAIGSIVGTFLAGFVLMYEASTTTIVHVVAAGLALLAAATMATGTGRLLAGLAAVALAAGAIGPVGQAVRSVSVGTTPINLVLLAGHALAAGAMVAGARTLFDGLRGSTGTKEADAGEPVSLRDLAALAFLISLSFMALEMVAGRLVTRHLGSSIYGWTSIIGVMLGGLSIGNFLGGRFADRITKGKEASWLFLAASVMTLLILFAETPPALLFPYQAELGSLLSRALTMTGWSWGMRVLWVVTVVFLLPAVTMGTVSPVVAKLAVERLRGRNRTGTAIGEVYAWGMVGSLLGTFLAGFVLIDVLGTKGLILVLATLLAIAATGLGSIWHAAWAGIPLGLCILAFMPVDWLKTQGVAWGVREETGDPNEPTDGLAYADESNYYFIKVSNQNVPLPGALAEPGELGYAEKRTLVLDNLIHGYFFLGHPEIVEYDYEFIYAQVTRRVAEAKAKKLGMPVEHVPMRVLFLGGGSYTFPRYLQHIYKHFECDVAEIDPAVTAANVAALGLPREPTITTRWGDARQFVEKAIAAGDGGKYDLVFGDAFNDFSVPWHLTTREFNDKIGQLLNEDGVYMINIIDVYRADDVALLEAVSDGQLAAMAKALEDSGNPADGAMSLAKLIRSSWLDENLAMDPIDVSAPTMKALREAEKDGPRSVDELKSTWAGAVATASKQAFRGSKQAMVQEAVSTLARAQAQRDQRAATDAVADFLRSRKVQAAAGAFRDAGIRWRADSLAERVVDNWFGGEEILEGILRDLNVEGDVKPLAANLESALNSVEAELKESPPLLGRRLILSETEQAEKGAVEVRSERREAAIAEKLKKAGVQEGAAELARGVAEALEDVRIVGGYRELAERAEASARGFATSPERLSAAMSKGLETARFLGAFLGSWVRTASKTFANVDVFGTARNVGSGLRETFVVVASKGKLDLSDLGRREGDPKFEQDDENFEPDPYSAGHMKALETRSRKIVLTDDYAPVENLLAPVAATRGDD